LAGHIRITVDQASSRSLAQVYETGSYAPFLLTLRLAGTSQASLVRFSQPGGCFPDPPTPDFTLAINERGSGRMRFDIGTGRKDQPFRPGDLVLKAPDVGTFFANSAPHQKSFVSLPAGMVSDLAEQVGFGVRSGGRPDLGALHDGVFRCPATEKLLALIWAEPAPTAPEGRLFVDGALMSLVALLLRHATSRPAPVAGPSALSPAKVARVTEWVAAHLAESFGLAEMAASACLSPYHFSRAFKAATGQTPRAFATECRIRHARDLLRDRGVTLAEIAQRCGFADQAHFTTAFRRHAGVTPGRYRRDRS
jgi:AraC family transcriptional regulator